MRGRRARWLIAIGAALVTTVATPVSPSVADSAPLRLIEQSYNISLGSSATFTVTMPPGLAAERVPLATYQVTSYERSDRGADIREVLAGSMPRIVDAVVIPIEGRVVSADLSQVTLSVPIAADNESRETLQFSRPGVYPVRIEIIDGALRGEVTTFVHRLDDAGGDPGINVAVVAHSPATVELDPDGIAQPAGDADQQLTVLADVLDASALPVGVGLDPAITTVSNLTQRLAESSQRHRLLSATNPPLDVAAAAAAGASDVYTEWLRTGEDTIATTLGAAARRSVYLAASPISTEAAILLRDLGTRLVVLPIGQYDSSEGSLGVFTDTSQLIDIDLGGDARLPAVVPDRDVSAVLADEALDPSARSVAVTSIVLADRQAVIDQGNDPSRHAVVIAMDDLRLPTAEVISAVTTLLSTTPGITPLVVDSIIDRTDTLLFDGRPTTIRLSASTGTDIAPRLAVRDALRSEIAGTGSMLVDEPDTIAEWNRRASVLPSTALTATNATSLSDGLRNEMTLVRDSVQLPTPFSFTITGSENTIRLSFANTSSRPLTIKVRLIAPRLIVPGGDQFAQLAPNATTTLEVEVRTRSNGRSPVSLDVFTPNGDIQLGERVPLTARVTSLAGVGNLVTGVALLMLITWWGRHWWRQRRDPTEDAATLAES